MLAGCHLGQAVLEPARLHLEKRDERIDLLFDSFEADQRVQLRLKLLQRSLGLGRTLSWERKLVADRPPHTFADDGQHVVKRTWHRLGVP